MVVGSPLPPPPKLPSWELSISLAWGTTAPPPGVHLFAHVVGGPNDLLVWLESQLGLHAPSDSAQRLAAINAATLTAIAQGGAALAISNPYKDHPYAVVGRLLEHRDSFLMAVPLGTGPAAGVGAKAFPVPCIDTCGLATAQAASLPELLQQYAAVMAAATPAQRDAVATGEPDRLARVFEAIADGQRLPTYRITIADDRNEWSGRWLSLLDTVAAQQKECVVLWSPTVCQPQVTVDSALHTVQCAIDPSFTHATVPPVLEDGTLRTVRCASMATASLAVAAALNGLSKEDLAAAIVVCEDDTTAALIDGHLHAYGLPTMGAAIAAQGSEIHSLLPLMIEALATPADPRCIKELLSVPESPIPWEARWPLRRAIDDLPAVGSPKWDDALAKIAAKSPKGPSHVSVVHKWIPVPSVGLSTSDLDPVGVRAAVKDLGEWARKKAHAIGEDVQNAFAAGLPTPAQSAELDIDDARRSHLQSLHAACKVFGSLIDARVSADPISRTEYLQLLDTASQTVPALVIHSETAGGPRRVRSFAELAALAAEVARVVWVGTSTTQAGRCQWSHHDIDAVRQKFAIDLDSSSQQLGAKRRAERSGLRQISTSLLIINHPSQDSESRPHPFWVTISEMLRAGIKIETEAAYEPQVLDPAKPPVLIAPWVVGQTATPVTPLPQPLEQIVLPPQVQVPPRVKTSQSELLKLLGCPVAWTLTYGCELWGQTGAGLKNESILKGSAAEQVMREVFEPSPPADMAAALAKLTTVLSDRLPFIHAGLCQPSTAGERRKFEHVLRQAVPVLQCLVKGGVQVEFGVAIGQFKTVQGATPLYNGIVPDGAIDVLGSVTVNGCNVPIVIDEKFGSREKYLKLLKEARCWQLVMYSDVKGQAAPGIPVDSIGYLVLTEGKLYVPAWAAGELADPRFSTCVEIVGTVGQATLAGQAVAFANQAAVAAAAAQQAGATLPAHPRIATAGGALHPDLAFVHGSNRDKAVDAACEFCDFGALCGKDRVR